MPPHSPNALSMSKLGALVLLTACFPNQPEPPDLGTQEYYEIRRDFRRCASPLCGGYFLKALNQSQTSCADGSRAVECYVAEVDFDSLGSRAPGRSAAVVRGRIEALEFDGFGNLGQLEVVEAWSASGSGEARFTYYRVGDNGIRCVTTPCFSTDAEVLNTALVESVSDIHFEQAGASEEAQARATSAITAGRLLMNGLAVPTPEGSALSALKLYLPLGIQCLTDGECGAREQCNAEQACFPPPSCRQGEDCPAVCSGYCVAAPSECTSATDCPRDEWCRFGEVLG